MKKLLLTGLVSFLTIFGMYAQGTPLPINVVQGELTPVACKGESTGALKVTVSEGQRGPSDNPYTLTVIFEGATYSEAVIQLAGGLANESYYDITNLKAGNFKLRAKDLGGNYADTDFTITEPTDITLPTATIQDDVCDNGKITLTNATGGTSPYQYFLNNETTATSEQEFTGLLAGDYFIGVKDNNGCIKKAVTATNVADKAFAIENLTHKDALCNGSSDGKVSFDILGGEPVDPAISTVFTLTATRDAAAYTLPDVIGVTTQADRISYQINGLPKGTYVIKVTDNNGCFIDVPFTIGEPTDITLPTATIQDDVCDNGKITLTNATGGTSPYQYFLNNETTATSEQEFTGLLAGDYFIGVKDNNGCIKKAVTATNVADKAFAIENLTHKDALCNGSSDGKVSFDILGGEPVDPAISTVFTLTATRNAAAYTLPDVIGVTTQADRISYQINGLPKGTYVIKVTDNNGCFIDVNFIINDPDPLTLPSVESRDAVCDNGYIKVTDAPAVTGGTTPYQYSIDNFATLQLEKEFADLSAGSYNFGVQDAHGCQISAPDPIVLGNRPLVWVDQLPENTKCSDSQDGKFTCTIKGGFKVDQPDGRHTITMTKDGQPYDYLDDFTFQVISATNNEINYVFRNLPVGAYNINFTDATGCSLGASFKINPAPAIVITETNNIAVTCKGLDNGAAEFNITGGTGGIDINPADPASFPVTGRINIALPVVEITNLLAGTYAMVASDLNNCQSNFFVTIDEPEEELAYAPNTGASACGGLTGGQIFGVATGGTPDYSYTATAVDFPYTDTNTTGTFEGLEAGAYDVVATDANGCTANATVQVRVLTIAPLTANPAANVVCPEQKTASVAFTVIGRTQAVAPADTASYYQVKLFNITQQHEVLAPDLKFSNKFHSPIYKYWTTQEPTLDEEGNVTFDEKGDTIKHPVRHRAMEFDKGCHEVTKEGEIEDYTPDKKGFECDDKVTLSGLGAGAYRAEIYQGACMIGEPIEFTIGITGSLPQVQINDVANFCDGTSYTIAPTITSVPGVNAYKWTLNGTEITKTKELKRSFTADEDGQLLQVEVKNACGSAVSNQLKITVRERPTAVLNLNKSYICAANPVLVSIAFKGTAPFTYELGNEGEVETQDALVQKEYIPTQTTTYSLTSLKDAYCTADVLVDTDTVQVDVYPEPEYFMDIDVPNPMINGRYVTITATPGFASYSLKMDGDPVPFATADSSNVFHTKQFNYGNGTYQFDLEITDANGCVWTLTENQDIESKIFPNIFTPNGDGVNDIFLAGYKIQVFNRWGTLLYEGTTGWDGTYNGHKANEGVYLYTVEIESTDGEPVVLHATLTLER